MVYLRNGNSRSLPDEAEPGRNRLECIEGLHARVDISISFLIIAKMMAQLFFITFVSCVSGENPEERAKV